MISDTVKYSSTPTIFDSKKVADDHPQNNSESSALASDIGYVRNSENIMFIKKPITNGFFNRVWRCFQTSDEKHSHGNICDEEGTELAEILDQGENLRQQANSLCSHDSEAPVPHGWRGSLLKRCLVGAGLLTGTGVLGGAGYAGYKYYNSGTSSTEKSLAIQGTGGSLEESFGNHTLYHDGAADRLRQQRHVILASNSNNTEFESIGDGWKFIFNNKLESINSRIIKLLHENWLLLDKKPKYKEKMFYALSRYLHYGDEVPEGNENQINTLVQKILYRSGIYGEKRTEQLSSNQAKSIVRYWVFRNILSSTPEKYIASKMKLDISRNYTVNDINDLLSVDNLPVLSDFQLDRLSKTEKLSIQMMWEDFLFEEMPFLASDDRNIKSILLKDFNFANLYSGSRFIKEIKGDDFSTEEIMAVGEALWKSATTEGVSTDKLAYYLTPALLFNATSLQGTKRQHEDDIEIINSYLNYRANINLLENDINNKTKAYISATQSWFTRRVLAEKITEQCASDVFIAESKKRAAAQGYMDNLWKPCDNAPDNLNDEYTKRTAYIADSFYEIDKYLIPPVFDLLPSDEMAFISDPSSELFMAKILVSSNAAQRFVRNGNWNEELIAPLNNTVIFTVQQNSQERIYALKRINNEREFYKLIRVDRVLDEYLKHDIIDDTTVHKYEPPAPFWGSLKEVYYALYDISQYEFEQVFKIDKQPVLIKQNKFNSLIDALRDSNRMTLFNELYQSGNDQSDSQQIWNVVKHIIPFYDCINSIIDADILSSAIDCIMDIISLIPVLGQATKLSTKFGVGLTQGLYKGMATVGERGVNIAVKNILQGVKLPTALEIASLGKNTVLALDPGFSLLISASRVSKGFAKKIVGLIADKKEMASLVASLNAKITELPLRTSNKQLTGVLAGTELEIPVVEVRKQGRENIYVNVNPQTGEKFGAKYICRGEGMLFPATSLLGRYKRSETTPYMNGSANDTYHRVKRMDGNRLRCSSPLAISPGSQYYINNYDEVIDIGNIPQLNEFLTRSAVHPYRGEFVNFNRDISDVANEMKQKIRSYYQREDFFAFSLNQNQRDIPAQYTLLRDRLGIYRYKVNRAKELVETLYTRFRDIETHKYHRTPGVHANSILIENYLSDLLRINTINDINIQEIIKKNAMTRLQNYVHDMNSFFQNEINNIYFVTANISPYNLMENASPERIGGFVFSNDESRRVIIMADFFSVDDLGRQLTETILHEASHLSGSLDYKLSNVGDALASMARFNNVALGLEPGHIELTDSVMEYYQHTTQRKISKEQLRELIRRDPVLRANLFMDNAYFLPVMIERLCAILQ